MERKSNAGKPQIDETVSEMETMKDDTNDSHEEDGGNSFVKKTWLTTTLYIGFIVTVRNLKSKKKKKKINKYMSTSKFCKRLLIKFFS